MNRFFNFFYQLFPFDKKWISFFLDKIIKFLPKKLLSSKFTKNCDFGVKVRLPFKILFGWGIIFTGRIHPIETEIFKSLYCENPGNFLLLGGYRDAWFNLVINNELKSNSMKSYVVEPVSLFSTNLKENLKINNAENIKLIKKGIGISKGKKKIYIDYYNEGGSNFIKKNSIFETIKVDKFDKILSDIGIHIDYLIIDIEGYEFYVLETAIKNKISFIMFEVLYEKRSNKNYNHILNLIKKTNYKFFMIDRLSKSIKKIENFSTFLNSESFNFILSFK